MGLIDQVKTAPTWVWISGGIGFLLLLFVATSKGSSVQTVGTPSTDVNDILNQLQDAADLVGGQDPPTTGNPPTGGGGTNPPPTTTPSIWGSDISATIKAIVSEAQIKAIFSKNQLGYGTTIDKSDLAALFAKLKLNPGTTINAEDVKYLVQQSNNNVKSIWGADIPIPYRLNISESEIKSLFTKNKINYGTVINQVDLQALFKKLKIPYGTTVDKGDLAYLAKKY